MREDLHHKVNLALVLQHDLSWSLLEFQCSEKVAWKMARNFVCQVTILLALCSQDSMILLSETEFRHRVLTESDSQMLKLSQNLPTPLMAK